MAFSGNAVFDVVINSIPGHKWEKMNTGNCINVQLNCCFVKPLTVIATHTFSSETTNVKAW